VHQVVKAVKLVICRSDLPLNPRWREQNYPRPDCWDIDEFFEEAMRSGTASAMYAEARRVFWEAYWRRLGRYKRGKPFFDAYEVTDSSVVPVRDRQRWILDNIVSSAVAHGVVPSEALRYTYRVYREVLPPAV